MNAAAAVPGFWDHRHQAWTVPVMVGELYVTDGDEHLATVLGSCVATCVRDRATGVGGMCHMLLPETVGFVPRLVGAMVEEVLAYGGHRDDLEVKLFGGGRVIVATSDIGALNVAAVRAYLFQLGLTVVAEDVGGPVARRLRYHPLTGHTLIQRLPMTVDPEGPIP